MQAVCMPPGAAEVQLTLTAKGSQTNSPLTRRDKKKDRVRAYSELLDKKLS